MIALGRYVASLVALVSLGAGATPNTTTPTPAAPPPTASKEARMHAQAAGMFEVKLVPQNADAGAEASVGRMLLDKTFSGDLRGRSQGQMLTMLTDIEGSAGYVAIERFTGTLKGRSGSFALQHSGLMTRGAPQLTIGVVPDSGTGALSGLAGSMTITITAGQHFYTFDYTLPMP
jgi:hypothetical protein